MKEVTLKILVLSISLLFIGCGDENVKFGEEFSSERLSDFDVNDSIFDDPSLNDPVTDDPDVVEPPPVVVTPPPVIPPPVVVTPPPVTPPPVVVVPPPVIPDPVVDSKLKCQTKDLFPGFGPHNNVCTRQVICHVEQVLGQTIESMTKTTDDRPNSTPSFWVKVDGCSGHVVYETFGGSGCDDVHYGSVPDYLFITWGQGSCSSLVPDDLYPRLK